MTDLTALKAALEAATQGEWTLDEADVSRDAAVYGIRIESHGTPIDCWSLNEKGEGRRNAAYIVATQPRVMREIIAEVERLRAQVGEQSSTLTKEAARAEMRRLEGDAEFRRAYIDRSHPDHCEAVRRMAHLAERANPAAVAGEGDRHD